MSDKKSETLVSVVILIWNGGDEVIGCIQHVLNQSYQAIELIIIDNNSNMSLKNNIHNSFPDLEMIENEMNVGYAKGMNQGIETAQGEYVLLLNQDVWIKQDFIDNAVRTLEKASDRVGMLAGKVYKLQGLKKTDHLLGGGHQLRKSIAFVGDPNVEKKHFTFSPIWCSPFLRKAMLDDVKRCSGHYFDEDYFAYGEDLDLALRSQLFGWKCIYSPGLEAWHAHSSSQQGRIRIWEKDPFIMTHALRNRHSTIIKDLPLILLIRFMPYILGYEILIWPFLLIKKPRAIFYHLGVCRETLCIIRTNRRYRKRIQRNRKVTSEYLRQYFIDG
jgi:GT2 family glycosyltransferase